MCWCSDVPQVLNVSSAAASAGDVNVSDQSTLLSPQRVILNRLSPASPTQHRSEVPYW